MNAFVNAVRNVPDSLTENGAATFSSSLKSSVDYFFTAGASRGKQEQVLKTFIQAANEAPDLTIPLALWTRDVRGGAGEREMFRQILKHLDGHGTFSQEFLEKIIEVGRFDDLLVVNKNFGVVAKFILEKIVSGNGLAAKWMPRKGVIAMNLRAAWGMSPKAYRKTLVNATKVVETQMCNKEWEAINFDHVPSVASARYNKAFWRNAKEKYEAYQASLVKGEAKINASAVFPHDVVRGVLHGGQVNTGVVDAQWNSLPNYLADGSNANDIIPMCDTSGSMYTHVSGSIQAIDVCIALGLYVTERQSGPYKNMILTFSEDSKFHTVHGATISDRISNLSSASWGMSTNLMSAFEAILNIAAKNSVKPEDMPKTLLIMSDMEFNQASRNNNKTNFQKAKEKFEKAGYKLPNIVFWNLNSRTANVPVRYDTDGTALISGFSPAIMGSVLGTDSFNPENIMLRTVDIPRYKVSKVFE